MGYNRGQVIKESKMPDRVKSFVPQGVSPAEGMILERREMAARNQSIDARWNGDIASATLLERYEKLARYLAECANRGVPFSEEMIREREEMEDYLWDRIDPSVKAGNGVRQSARDLISDIMKNLVSSQSGIITPALTHRSKFEGWLKWELISALFMRGFNPIPEDKRHDLRFDYAGLRYYLELKTANTNWRAEGIENKTRPITMNIKQICDDVDKVAGINGASERGIVAFYLFPVPLRIYADKSSELYRTHIPRIEHRATSLSGELNWEYVSISTFKDVGLIIGTVDWDSELERSSWGTKK